MCERENHNDDIFNTGSCALCNGTKPQYIENLINWKEVSRRLSGSDNSIRSNKCPKKYQKKVDRLIKLIDMWCYWTNRA